MLKVRPTVIASKQTAIAPTRRISAAAAAAAATTSRIQSTSPTFPVIPTCPSPTCACAETPAGLDIERERGLNGSMAPYAQHVVISTGKSDWTSRIEDDGHGTPWGDLGRQLKAMLGRGGKYSDPYNNIMITNSSFADRRHGQRLLVFPSFESVLLSDTRTSTVERFIQQYLLPENLHPLHEALSVGQRKTLTRVPDAFQSLAPRSVSPVRTPTILICGHRSRDSRCGVLGPLLESEFGRQLGELGFTVSTKTVPPEHESRDGVRLTAQVSLISHIGGHKWAGNVIAYVPPGWPPGGKATVSEGPSTSSSPLAGCGIWYGRVEPKHVEGIIKETILGGNVIRDLFRGGIGPHSEVLRVPLAK